MTAQRGFSLIELAIVLVIVTILIGGLAVPLSAQIQARRIAETNKTLEEAQAAIMGYTLSHIAIASPPSTCTCHYKGDTTIDIGPSTTCPVSLCPKTGNIDLNLPISRHYLPCPDLLLGDPEAGVDNDGDGDLNDLNNGREDRYVAGACSTPTGNLPWVTLGAAAQDAWGNRLRYQVTAAFANSSSGFSNTDTGDLQICSASGCATVNVASNVPAVLVSYGPNGWGGRNINNNTLAAPTSADERENTNADVNYVSRFPSKPGDSGGEFDDLLRWISADQLRGRICPVGGCP